MAVTTLDDVVKALDELSTRVAVLEDQPRPSKAAQDRVNAVADRVEDICDFRYGTNVRPPLTDREDDDYPADVKPSNEDDVKEKKGRK